MVYYVYVTAIYDCMYANQTAGEKAKQQLHKNDTSNFEQVLEATPNKAPAVRPPTSHHEKAGEAGTSS